MSIRVLIVDDSPFLRASIRMMLENDQRLEVVGEAKNGAEAVVMTADLQPDVITMDIEMPVMDGITATKRIMQSHPTPILMFSSLTTDGAEATLAALEAGAVDYLPKHFEEISWNRKKVVQVLCERLYSIARHDPGQHSDSASIRTFPSRFEQLSAKQPQKEAVEVVVFGTSTGGPMALQEILTQLPENFPYPILLVQHMPANFTPTFAQHMNQLCAITVKEAEDGDDLLPARALLAPGGKQMSLENKGGRSVVRIHQAEPEQSYKPSVDLTLNSIAVALPGRSLAVILTGMGEDGCEGCRSIKSSGASVWTQDEASSVVYGMPAAVIEAGLSDRILGLKEFGPALLQL